MHIVGIIELGTPVDSEAQALAAALGGTPYEHRLRLLGGFPATVLTTTDSELAARTLAALESRGHAAIALDGANVIASERMLAIRRFRLESQAVVLDAPGQPRLPASDVAALVRAVHRTRTDTRTEVQTKSFSLGRALATGGMLPTKAKKLEQRSSSHETEPVLYVFRRSGETPWILRERGTNYSALGSELAPSSMQNFHTTVRLLRELAPHAAYDERLLTLRVKSGPPIVRAGSDEQSVTTSTASSVDIAAQLLASWLQKAT